MENEPKKLSMSIAAQSSRALLLSHVSPRSSLQSSPPNTEEYRHKHNPQGPARQPSPASMS